MLLCLMRHGIAIDREDPACPPEPERHLTEKGMDRTRAAARGLRTLGIQPGLVLSSPYLRAIQTAEIVCVLMEIPVNSIRQTEALLPGASPRMLFDELSKSKAEEAICIGHAPNLDDVIAAAVHAAKACTQLKKAGAAYLEMDSFQPVDGRLIWLMTARALRDLRD
ncbi:MAG TPA: histidine phosphatase family protein [Candidatus Acidoferrales bacterium]|nr:histidine phosphatase family protein [Candidatus Acidoferrales bacterium]